MQRRGQLSARTHAEDPEEGAVETSRFTLTPLSSLAPNHVNSGPPQVGLEGI